MEAAMPHSSPLGRPLIAGTVAARPRPPQGHLDAAATPGHRSGRHHPVLL